MPCAHECLWSSLCDVICIRDEDAAASLTAGVRSVFSPTLARVSLELSSLLVMVFTDHPRSPDSFTIPFYNIARIVKVKYPKMIYSELSNSEAVDAGSIFPWLNLGTFHLCVQEWQYWGSSLSVHVGKSTSILSALHVSSKFATRRFPGTKQGFCVFSNSQ